jgi:nucleoside-diphosphate-sugar epimerase
MPTVLMTGASGFTGRLMTQALRCRDMDVVTLDCDLLNQKAVEAAVMQVKPDWVVHLAALSFVGDSDSQAFYRVNVFGTLNLLEALKLLKTPPARVLIASSANIYGTPEVDIIHEGITPAPVNHYACSKLVMEHMVQPWCDHFPIVITRPFNYTGSGQNERFLIPKIVSHFQRKSPTIELGNLDVSRDFSDVRDVVAAYISLLESSVSGVKVNICSGRAIALRQVLDYMNEISGYTIEVLVNPAFVRANEIPVLRGDNRLLQQLVGHVPAILIEQTLSDMYMSA